MGDDDSTFTSPMVAQEPAAKTPRKAAAVVRVPADGASGASGSAGEQVVQRASPAASSSVRISDSDEEELVGDDRSSNLADQLALELREANARLAEERARVEALTARMSADAAHT